MAALSTRPTRYSPARPGNVERAGSGSGGGILLAMAALAGGAYFVLHKGAPAVHVALMHQLSVIDSTSGDRGAFKLAFSGPAGATGDKLGVITPQVPQYPVPFSEWLWVVPAHAVQGHGTIWGPFHDGTYGVYYNKESSDEQQVTAAFQPGTVFTLPAAYSQGHNLLWVVTPPPTISIVLGPVQT